jgi:hypothetical protein
VKPEPCGVHQRRHDGEVILEGVGGDGHGEEGVPLWEDVWLEVENDQDEGADVLDWGGLRLEVGIGGGMTGSGAMGRKRIGASVG